MTNFKIDIDSTKAKRMFNNASKAVSNPIPAFKEIRTYQLKQIQEAFKTSGKNIIGKPWKKLSPNYLKSKIKSGFLESILIRTGKMRSSFKSIKLNTKILSITSVGVPYFKNHQQGKSGGTFKAKLPQRQILGHSKAMIQRTMKIFIDFINNSIKNG